MTGNKFRAIVAANKIRFSANDKQISQDFSHNMTSNTKADIYRKTFSDKLIYYIAYSYLTAIFKVSKKKFIFLG